MIYKSYFPNTINFYFMAIAFICSNCGLKPQHHKTQWSLYVYDIFDFGVASLKILNWLY